MDQLKKFFQVVKKYHFWILCLLILLAYLGTWYMATSAMTKETTARINEISTGLGQGRGRFRTAIIASGPTELKLASFYQSLAKRSDLEVEICSSFEEAFAWLGCENPDPERYR